MPAPSRGAVLTGQWHWRLKGAANLWSVFPDEFATYPEILEKAGYAVGVTGKGWGPGRTESRGRKLVGEGYKNFQDFLARKPSGKPFCFWLGTSDPHRPYARGSGVRSGMKLDKVRLPACFPNVPEVRSNVADYYWEVQRFDRLVGSAVSSLEKSEELGKTIVVMTGDHGMPFPRCKSNLYDSGARVPLAICWPDKVKGGRELEDFVSFTDLAPTFLEAAGVTPPGDMTGRSLVSFLTGSKAGRVDPERGHVLMGKERHVVGQEKPDAGGYPCRAIRTYDFLYIRNFRPYRWPAGTPNPEKAQMPGAWYADCDNGPTKTYMVDSRDKSKTNRRLYELAFGKRPAEELYDLKKDPDQLQNVAGNPAYAEAKAKLAARLMAELKATEDPRALGHGDFFDAFPYLGGVPKLPGWRPKKTSP